MSIRVFVLGAIILLTQDEIALTATTDPAAFTLSGVTVDPTKPLPDQLAALALHWTKEILQPKGFVDQFVMESPYREELVDGKRSITVRVIMPSEALRAEVNRWDEFELRVGVSTAPGSAVPPQGSATFDILVAGFRSVKRGFFSRKPFLGMATDILDPTETSRYEKDITNLFLRVAKETPISGFSTQAAANSSAGSRGISQDAESRKKATEQLEGIETAMRASRIEEDEAVFPFMDEYINNPSKANWARVVEAVRESMASIKRGIQLTIEYDASLKPDLDAITDNLDFDGGDLVDRTFKRIFSSTREVWNGHQFIKQQIIERKDDIPTPEEVKAWKKDLSKFYIRRWRARS
jgi:hypothetical protein